MKKDLYEKFLHKQRNWEFIFVRLLHLLNICSCLFFQISPISKSIVIYESLQKCLREKKKKKHAISIDQTAENEIFQTGAEILEDRIRNAWLIFHTTLNLKVTDPRPSKLFHRNDIIKKSCSRMPQFLIEKFFTVFFPLAPLQFQPKLNKYKSKNTNQLLVGLGLEVFLIWLMTVMKNDFSERKF